MTARTVAGAFLLLFTVPELPAYQQRSTIEIVRIIAERGREPALPMLNAVGGRDKADRCYLEGLAATSETEALRYFRIVADSLPPSEWADDALARIAEIFSGTGLHAPAEESVRRLRLEYPYSSYVTTGYFPLHGDSGIAAAPPERAAGAEYAVQIGAFAVPDNARRLRDAFAGEGYDVTVHENFLDGKHLLYLVWVGRYATMEEALTVRRAIQQKHAIDGILRTRSSWRRW